MFYKLISNTKFITIVKMSSNKFKNTSIIPLSNIIRPKSQRFAYNLHVLIHLRSLI